MFNAGYGNCYAPSLADIAAVSRNNDDGFGNNGAWWVWIILFAMFGGWGWGNGNWGGANGQQATQSDIQRSFDTQTMLGSLRGLEQGMCNLGYENLAQTNGVNMNIAQTGWNLQSAISNLGQRMDNCCCENREAIAQVRYDMSTDTCAITRAIENASAAEIQNANNLYIALDNKIDGLIMADKDRQIANLQMQLNSCDRDKALQGTASYIISTLHPQVVPTVPANQYYGYGQWGNCCNSNPCGC